MEKEKEIYDVTVSEDRSPASIMMLALSKGQDLDRLEKLLELQERYERNEARKAYHSAMTCFKSNPPQIIKDAHVKYATAKGVTDYRHATLANVVETVGVALAEHGLSATWKTDQKDGQVTVTCVVTHEMGHSESTSLSAPHDNSGGKNAIQAIGSAVSYLQRYTLLSLLGLASKDMDDDGISSNGTVFIDGDELQEIKKIVRLHVTDMDAFLRFAQAESLDTIPLKNKTKVVNALNKKINERMQKAVEAKREREPGEEG